MSGKKNKRKRREKRRQRESNPEREKRCKDDQERQSDCKKQRTMVDPAENNDDVASNCLIFQEVMQPIWDHPNVSGSSDASQNKDEIDADTEISNTMFELANSPLVGFRVNATKVIDPNNAEAPSSCTIVVKQDINACNHHTGGIVWETAYLLLQYLQTKNNLGITLEVGAGCGMLGQVLAAQRLCKTVIMTEHKDVLPNLTSNWKRNTARLSSLHSSPVHICELDWEECEQDVQLSKDILKPHSCDTIVGTDVVFSPKLVEPLWKTLQLMSHPKTNIYLCLQERCAASHKLLLEKASVYGFDMEDISTQFDKIPSCRWGSSLECKLFHITRKQM